MSKFGLLWVEDVIEALDGKENINAWLEKMDLTAALNEHSIVRETRVFASSPDEDLQALETASEVLPSAERKVNAWLEDAQLPLQVGERYKIGVNIGAPRQDALGGGPFHEPDWGNQNQLDLVIALHGRGAKIEPVWQYGTLPKSSDMPAVYFDVEPHEEGMLELYLSIFLAHELVLLEEFQLTFEVVATSSEALS